MATNIILPEHNSSRLLFIDNQLPDFNLDIVDLEQDSSEKDRCVCSSKFLLGKLNNYVWFLEDSGEYDTNHTHQAEIVYNNSITNTTETLFNVKRIMEYGGEADRLYTAHSGGLKIILIDSPIENQTTDLFIKYERTLPGLETITDLKNNNTNEIYHGCIVFKKYINNVPTIYQIVQIINGVNVIDNNTQLPMQNIEYCNIDVKNVSIDFNRIKYTYSISPNNTNDIKIGYLGTSSLFIDPQNGNYGKFIGSRYYLNNDSFIEPGYFIVQAPKNRSWICFRNLYSSTSYTGTYCYIIPQSNISTLTYEYEIKHKNNYECCYINKSSLNGYYGNLENNKYVYEINIDRNIDKNYFILMIPSMFADYESFEYLDNNDNIVSNYMDLGANEFVDTYIYNELDGMFYKLISLPIIRTYCKVYKIKITYNKV